MSADSAGARPGAHWADLARGAVARARSAPAEALPEGRIHAQRMIVFRIDAALYALPANLDVANLSPNGATEISGNTSGVFYAGSVTATNQEANAWWQVDLGTPQVVNKAVIQWFDDDSRSYQYRIEGSNDGIWEWNLDTDELVCEPAAVRPDVALGSDEYPPFAETK